MTSCSLVRVIQATIKATIILLTSGPTFGRNVEVVQSLQNTSDHPPDNTVSEHRYYVILHHCANNWNIKPKTALELKANIDVCGCHVTTNLRLTCWLAQTLNLCYIDLMSISLPLTVPHIHYPHVLLYSYVGRSNQGQCLRITARLTSIQIDKWH